ncbi:MAG: DEAD/DEAH box helicase family protein [Nanoarchaeota archaeon]
MTTQTTLSQHRKWLYDELDTAKKFGVLSQYLDTPNFIKDNLNPNQPLRNYQKEAFARFFYYYNQYPDKESQIHLLYNMATGSGKTLIMAGLILYLYEKGYRNFLFFVNSTNIIEKTKDNFLNNLSIKYLFNQKIVINNKEINVNKVDNFEGVNKEDINICFTTIQKLHSDLYAEKENSLTFEDFKNQKIVFLADEAHHGQTQTKQNTIFKVDEKPNWENTVLSIFQQNKENILLEFTATMDFMNKAMEAKYISKVIYKYDLRQFRNDKFSKDVEILRSDTDKKGRILLALILNQYRQDIASKYGIQLKPVILFKAQKTIEQSEENKNFFHNLIDNLSKNDIENIKKKTDIREITRAFEFYEKEKITTDIIIHKLKINFASNKCVSMNDDKTIGENQILINTLEKSDNQIRAIFTVQKLNEGWDVLNLFDIVRLYEGQASGGSTKGGISPSTISEAQLIGRGARYYPFKIDNKEKFLRKFDEDLNNELRIIEELHFHSWNESRYISELKNALVQEGLMDDKMVNKELKLKEEFKKSGFFKNGQIFLNKKIANDYSYATSFADLGVNEKDFKYEIITYKGKVTEALTNEKYDNLYIVKESQTIQVKQIDKHIFQNAISRKEFFKFENLKNFFPKLNSVNDLIENKDFLADIKINFTGSAEDLYNLSTEHKFKAVISILDEIEEKLKNNMVDYRGTKEFFSSKINEVFYNKVIRIETGSERENGQESFVREKEWYAFNANYGTSEEKACVEFIDRLIKEEFKNKYKEIFLLRNELHFVIYNFSDGKAFAPDFVLFMKDKEGKEVTYQIFIEPKGKFLEKTDEWKEKLLIEINEMFKSKGLTKFIETKKYRVFGVPFFNQEDENKFKEGLLDAIK